MKTRNEILECVDGDRYIFIRYENEKVEWLNFHQGIDDIDMAFNKPCEMLTKIYKALTYADDYKTRGSRFYAKITQAIELYYELMLRSQHMN